MHHAVLAGFRRSKGPVAPAPDRAPDRAPVDPAPVDPAPVATVPVDPVPVDPAPVDPAPVATVPVDPADLVPVAPADPADLVPAGPADPVDLVPVAPADPVDRVDLVPVVPVVPVDRAPADLVDLVPADPVDRAPVAPADPVDPVVLVDPVDPVVLVDLVAPAGRTTERPRERSIAVMHRWVAPGMRLAASVHPTTAHRLRREREGSAGMTARLLAPLRVIGTARRLRVVGMAPRLRVAGTAGGTARRAIYTARGVTSGRSTTTTTRPFRASVRSLAVGASGTSVSGSRCSETTTNSSGVADGTRRAVRDAGWARSTVLRGHDGKGSSSEAWDLGRRSRRGHRGRGSGRMFEQ